MSYSDTFISSQILKITKQKSKSRKTQTKSQKFRMFIGGEKVWLKI